MAANNNNNAQSNREAQIRDAGFADGLKYLVLDVLRRNGVHSTREIADAYGIEVKFIWQAINKLKTEGLVREIQLKDMQGQKGGSYFYFEAVIEKHGEIPDEPAEITDKVMEDLEALMNGPSISEKKEEEKQELEQELQKELKGQLTDSTSSRSLP